MLSFQEKKQSYFGKKGSQKAVENLHRIRAITKGDNIFWRTALLVIFVSDLVASRIILKSHPIVGVISDLLTHFRTVGIGACNKNRLF